MSDTPPILAIVDFADELGADPVRRCFTSPVRVLRADHLDDVLGVLDEADRLGRSGLWVVGFVSYDASPAFDAAFAARRDTMMPLAWFAAFEDVSATLPDDREPSRVASVVKMEPVIAATESVVTDRQYDAAVERIRQHIAEGEVYQVNLTVPFTGASPLAPRQLYERLRAAQGGRYAAHLHAGDVHIMSASPELFFERHGDTIRSRPMKGTAARGLYPAADARARRALVDSEKDRAENVMIVDVVRNDIGRIARVGSVRVTSLCEPERYPSVWQLTSTVEGEVDADVPLSRVFGAMFPPASVTGAPKIRATRIIQELEPSPRAVYCGAVGVIRPGGDATFNVAIRTAWSVDGGCTVHLNAGGGVTIDSTSAGELAELHTKLAAFTIPAVRPGLFETMRLEHGAPIRLERHLARLAASADYFGLPFDGALARETIHRAALDARQSPIARCRLVLTPDGSFGATAEPHVDGDHGAAPRPVALAPLPVDRRDVRLYHKTTDRDLYEGALAAAGGAFDVILWNEAGEATELTRGNLVAELDGARWTPPIACGLLGGTLRAELLESGEIAERVITLDELTRANRVWFVNSLRGWVRIELAD